MSINDLTGSTESIQWSDLSDEERFQGIHPEKLGKLSFKGDGLTEAKLNEITQFFLGCKLAATDSEFKFQAHRMLERNEKLSASIKEIVGTVLEMPKPAEETMERLDYLFSPAFTESTRPYPSSKIFLDLYTSMIHENKGYLMHPARREELMEIVKAQLEIVKAQLPSNRKVIDDLIYLPLHTYETFDFQLPSTGQFVDDLITFHTQGYDMLKAQRLESKIEDKLKDLRSDQLKLEEMRANPRLILDPTKLQREDFRVIWEGQAREYVYLMYKDLAMKGLLDILQLPQEQLYYTEYQYNTIRHAHPHLSSFCSTFDHEAGIFYSFNKVVKCLKTLKNSNLSELEAFIWEERISEKEENIAELNKILEDINKNYVSVLGLLTQKIKAEDFAPGDFSTLSVYNESERQLTLCTKVFQAIDKLQVWELFDSISYWDIRQEDFLSLPTVNQIIRELDFDEYDQSEFNFAMSEMKRVREDGWYRYVSKRLNARINHMRGNSYARDGMFGTMFKAQELYTATVRKQEADQPAA